MDPSHEAFAIQVFYNDGDFNGDGDGVFWTASLTSGYAESKKVLAHWSSPDGAKDTLSELLNALGKALYSKVSPGEYGSYGQGGEVISEHVALEFSGGLA